MTAIRPYLRLAQPDVHHLSAAEQEGMHKALKASVEVVHAPKHEAQPSGMQALD
jgi:hypothetical protein